MKSWTKKHKYLALRYLLRGLVARPMTVVYDLMPIELDHEHTDTEAGFRLAVAYFLGDELDTAVNEVRLAVKTTFFPDEEAVHGPTLIEAEVGRAVTCPCGRKYELVKTYPAPKMEVSFGRASTCEHLWEPLTLWHTKHRRRCAKCDRIEVYVAGKQTWYWREADATERCSPKPVTARTRERWAQEKSALARQMGIKVRRVSK